MLKIKSITLLIVILFTSSVFAAFPPGDTTQVNLYTRADMCINCDQNATDAFVLSLVPYSLNNSEFFIFIVDPVLSSKVVYEVEAFQSSKVITRRRDMTANEGVKFEPLMVYAKNVVALKQIITQKNPDGLLNTDTCDSSLDAHSNRSCAAALINDLRLEAEIRNLFNIPKFDYSVTVGGSVKKVINGSITVSGQGSDGILRVIYSFDDGSIAVYKVTAEGEVIKIELDLESSLTAGQEVLKLIIDALARDKFSAFGIRGHELDDFSQMWAGGQGHFCNLVPTYKMVQAEKLQCASYPTIAGLEIRCRLITSTAAPQAAYTCS